MKFKLKESRKFDINPEVYYINCGQFDSQSPYFITKSILYMTFKLHSDSWEKLEVYYINCLEFY